MALPSRVKNVEVKEVEASATSTFGVLYSIFAFNLGRGKVTFANFAHFLTRHSSKSDGWFAAKKGAEVGGINKFIRSKSNWGDKLYEYGKIRNNRSRRLGKEPA